MNAKVWLCIILALFWWADINAQESPVGKGTFMIDGSIRLSSIWGDDFSVNKKQNIVVTPSVMYFPFSNFAVGGRINIQNYDLYGTEVRRSIIGLTSGLYAGVGSKKSYLYSELSFGLIAFDVGGYSDGSGYEYGVGFGVLNFVTDNIAVRGGLDYTIQKVERGPYRVEYFPYYKAGAVQDLDDKKEGRITQIVIGLSYFIH